jgi:hypothetical protein
MPKKPLTRAESFVVIARVRQNPLESKAAPVAQTPILGDALLTFAQAQAWARSAGAAAKRPPSYRI